VEAARLWRTTELHYTRGPNGLMQLNDRPTTLAEAGAKRRIPADPGEDYYPGAPGEVSMFICAARFAAAHGPRKYGALLVHIASSMSDEGWDGVNDSGEVPEAIWAVWDDATKAYWDAFKVQA